ncbi:unnamed protein product [Clavelina lepadiformis]|uniref:NSF AAA+ ATPase lid domain-containing protein n=1 Tax=Clavelina lepadiformis TaxID=159417 RepID=A0ABP0FQD0_CLALP
MEAFTPEDRSGISENLQKRQVSENLRERKGFVGIKSLIRIVAAAEQEEPEERHSSFISLLEEEARSMKFIAALNEISFGFETEDETRPKTSMQITSPRMAGSPLEGSPRSPRAKTAPPGYKTMPLLNKVQKA